MHTQKKKILKVTEQKKTSTKKYVHVYVQNFPSPALLSRFNDVHTTQQGRGFL